MTISFWVSWDCGSGSWPCRAGRWARCGVSAGGTTGTTSWGAAAVCRQAGKRILFTGTLSITIFRHFPHASLMKIHPYTYRVNDLPVSDNKCSP